MAGRAGGRTAGTPVELAGGLAVLGEKAVGPAEAAGPAEEVESY